MVSGGNPAAVIFSLQGHRERSRAGENILLLNAPSKDFRARYKIQPLGSHYLFTACVQLLLSHHFTEILSWFVLCQLLGMFSGTAFLLKCLRVSLKKQIMCDMVVPLKHIQAGIWEKCLTTIRYSKTRNLTALLRGISRCYKGCKPPLHQLHFLTPDKPFIVLLHTLFSCCLKARFCELKCEVPASSQQWNSGHAARCLNVHLGYCV